MNVNQRQELIAACESGNRTRVVTIALQICAASAREGRKDEAIVIRNLIDAEHRREHVDLEYRRMRMDVAKRIYASIPQCDSATAVHLADGLLKAVAEIEVPK